MAKPKRNVELIALAAARVKLRESRGASEQQHQYAGCQRIERAEMADLAEAQHAAHRLDHVVRGSAARLVDHQRAVEGRRARILRVMVKG